MGADSTQSQVKRAAMEVKVLPILPDIYVRILELIKEDENVSSDFKKALESK